MNKEKQNDLIDKYALGTLTESELILIKNEMKNNPNLVEDLNIRLDIAKSLEINSNKELKLLLDKIHAEEIEGKKSWLKYLIGLLALIALGIIALIVNKESSKSFQPDAVYATYYKPYQASFQNRSELNSGKLAKFQEFYADGNYKLAIQEILPVLVDTPDDIKLAAGISALETNKLEVAERLFREIIVNQDIYYKDHANWYLALLHLKTGKSDMAKELLSELASDTKADHHKESADLLQKLK